MKKILMLSLVLALALTLCPGTAWGEENVDFLGKPFPDFTVTDTEGNPFTLSEALKTHEAVLINFWATWCGPCKAEFPALSQVYAEYSDRVAFIALSIEPKDTPEAIKAYRGENDIPFPMGRDEDRQIYTLTGLDGRIPVTVIVDRFGNAVFCQPRAFRTDTEIRQALDAFLGEDYRESAVPAAKAEDLQAYIIHVVDQNDDPVEEVMVNFCTDTACTPQESDATGTIAFAGAPEVYHVQLIDVPEGYSCDEGFELYTTREYGEWILRVRKD